MEPQTLFNIIFVVFMVLSLAVIIHVKWEVVSTKVKKIHVRDIETFMDDDGYGGDLDQIDANKMEVLEVLPGDPVEDVASTYGQISANESAWCDLLVHHNAANLPITQFVAMANSYYRADLLSASNVMINKLNDSETFCNVKPIPNAYSSFNEPYTDNAHHQWCSSMSEIWFCNEYAAAHKAKFRATSETVCYKSAEPYSSHMCVVRLSRLVDRKEFYYVHFTQTFKNSYTDDRSYKTLVQAINTLQRFHKDCDFVIVGNFNVHGHEKVFQHHLPGHYTVCDMRAMPTNMDMLGRGIASPDGLIVSQRVYEAVEYQTELSGLNATNGALVMTAKLYIKHPKGYRGAIIRESWPLRRMIKDLADSLTKEKKLLKDVIVQKENHIYYDTDSLYDPLRHAMDATMVSFQLRANTTTAGTVNDVRASRLAQVEPISSNVLYRNETPVTVAKHIGNNVVVVDGSTHHQISASADIKTLVLSDISKPNNDAKPMSMQKKQTSKVAKNKNCKSSIVNQAPEAVTHVVAEPERGIKVNKGPYSGLLEELKKIKTQDL